MTKASFSQAMRPSGPSLAMWIVVAAHCANQATIGCFAYEVTINSEKENCVSQCEPLRSSPSRRALQDLWEERSGPGCQGPQRKYAGYLSTVKVSGSRNSKVIGKMVRKEVKRMEKSKRSEATLTACMDDHWMNEDSNLSHSVRASKRGKQSRDDDTN